MAISLFLYSSKYYRNYSEFTVLFYDKIDINWIRKSTRNLYFSIETIYRLDYLTQLRSKSTTRKQMTIKNIVAFLPSRQFCALVI